MAQEQPGQTLQPTALVHEAFLRLVGDNAPQHWNSRGHFFGAAAEALRRILVEQARKKDRVRHGGTFEKVDLRDVVDSHVPDAETVLAVNEAVTQLAEQEPEVASLINLHFFAGLTLDETAETLEVSREPSIDNGLTRGPACDWRSRGNGPTLTAETILLFGLRPRGGF